MKATVTLAAATWVLLAACTDRSGPDAAAPTPAESTSTSSVATDPATSDGAQSQEETASSAAAAAPECKEISQTRPGACEPDAHATPPAPTQ